MLTCILVSSWEPTGFSIPSSEPGAPNPGHCPGRMTELGKEEGNSAAEPLEGLASNLGCHPPLPLPRLQVLPEHLLWAGCAFFNLGNLLISGFTSGRN